MDILESFFVGIVFIIVGGIVLVVFFFWVWEKCFGVVDVIGKWYFNMIMEKIVYNLYKGMELCYICVVWWEGNYFYGFVEKVYEKFSIGICEYVGKNCLRGKLIGVYEKNYFSKDWVYIYISE